MMKKTASVVSCLLLVVGIYGCARVNKAIQIRGSDTMVNLAQAWAEEYMDEHREESIAVTGGGSGTGIASLINKTTDIAQCSREMKLKEIEEARKNGVEPKELQVASDGIVVAVHPSNPVSKLTIKQISDIFIGKTKNWKDLGGPDLKIVALSRDRNSGTHVFFLEQVVKLGERKNKNEFAPEVLMMPSSQTIIEEIAGNPSAVGYIGLGYLSRNEKAVAVARDEKSPYILPNIKTVKSGEYPISRSLLFYTDGAPNPRLKLFIDFVLSPAGQRIVQKMDFVPVR